MDVLTLGKTTTEKASQDGQGQKGHEQAVRRALPRTQIGRRAKPCDQRKASARNALSQPAGLGEGAEDRQAAISLIETARANPTLLMIEQIAAALRVTAGELLTSQK